MNLSLITTSVNYSDYLSETLQYNHKIFSTIYIVTSIIDSDTQQVCKAYSNVICLPTDVFYSNNAIFNKGAAINHALNIAVKTSDWIVIGDADCIFPQNIVNDINDLNTEYIYTYPRSIVKNKTHLSKLLKGEVSPVKTPGICNKQICGYCQIFSTQSVIFLQNPAYSETSIARNRTRIDARLSDLEFSRRWDINHRKILESGFVIHLGQIAKNWSGRKSSKWD